MKTFYTRNQFLLQIYQLQTDLLRLLNNSISTNRPQFGIFQGEKYICSVATTPDGKFYVFETHPISPECNGNGNGVFVITNSCSRLIEC